MGRQQRTKQGDPTPLIGSSEHPHAGVKVGKRKAGLEAKALREGTVRPVVRPSEPRKSKQTGFLSGRSQSAPGQGGSGAPGVKSKKGKGQQTTKPKRAPRKSLNGQGGDDDDDLEGLKDDEDVSEDDEAFQVAEAKSLETARASLFNDEDLNAPKSDNDEDDEELDEGESGEWSDEGGGSGSDDDGDEFDLGEEDDGEQQAKSGVTLDDFEMTAEEAEQMPASGKKANKRLARKVYNSDDEADPMDQDDDLEDEPAQGKKGKKGSNNKRSAPEAVEGQEEDATLSELEEDSEDEVEEGPLDDLRAVERRMRNSARVLGNWKELGPAVGKSRSDLVEQLIGDVCQYHGYSPYLAEKLFDLFGVDEALQFFNTSDTPRPLTLRVNTLKTRRRDLAQALINRGVNLEPLEGGWSKVGLQVFSGGGVPVGATPEYLAGHYILQSASSFLPVIALSPQPHERVLDMSAAPGGKTTYMSALMGNTGEVWANDSSRGRIKGLGGNVARLGCKNVIITNVDGREFPKIIGGFDRVLLDAPCSGTGVISKDQSVKVNKTERDFTLLSHLQKQLVLCAIDSVTPNSTTGGGFVVYSTCSVTTEENEAVVSYALRKRPHVKLVETGLAFGKEGFQRFRGKEFGKNMHLTRRFYPHVHNMDGFFVAKFKVGKPEKAAKEDESLPESYVPLVEGASDDEDNDGDETFKTAFDDEEDAELIAATKKRQLKQQGVNTKATKAHVASKAVVEEPPKKKARKASA